MYHKYLVFLVSSKQLALVGYAESGRMYNPPIGGALATPEKLPRGGPGRAGVKMSTAGPTRAVW